MASTRTRSPNPPRKDWPAGMVQTKSEMTGAPAVVPKARRARAMQIGPNFWRLHQWEDDGGAFVFPVPFRNLRRGAEQGPGKSRVIGI